MARRVSFRSVAIAMVSCALVAGFLNVYMNIVASYSMPALQLDMSPNGDLMGFHQLDMGHRENLPHDPLDQQFQRAADPFESQSADCPGLCPLNPGQDQVSFVESLLEQRMRRLPETAFSVLDVHPKFKRPTVPPSSVPSSSSYSKVWKTVADWVSSRQLFPSRLDISSLVPVIGAVSSASVVQSSVPTKGTQLKAAIVLEGLQKALFKPKRYQINATAATDSAYGGADRHNGEIAAFYLGALLQLNRVPVAVGRRLHLERELRATSTAELNATFFNSKDGLCFFGKCMYCTREEPVCQDKDGFLEGATILWLPTAFENLQRIRSPWARTYKPHKLAEWQTDVNYCEKVRQHKIFGKSPVYLDLMDTAVFDYLIGNADRHRLEFFQNADPLMVLLIDNGKSFGNAALDELSILAPIYQCCQMRQTLYDRMMQYSELNVGQMLDEKLRLDPLYPILSNKHLEAVNRRLRKVLNLLATCIEQHGISYVLKNDGF